MKHLKEYLNYNTYSNIKYNNHSFLTNDLLSDIGLNIDNPKGESIYNIDVDKYLKEIYLNKKVKFNNEEDDKWITGIVNDVNLDYWRSRNTIYILLKIGKYWYRINDKHFNIVYDYDAENKPEHSKLKIAKTANKYNI